MQNRLSYRDPGDLPMALACAKRDVSYLAYSPLGGSADLLDLTGQDLEDLRAVPGLPSSLDHLGG